MLINFNVSYLKIPKKHRGPHKTLSRAKCDPRLWDPWFRDNEALHAIAYPKQLGFILANFKLVW